MFGMKNAHELPGADTNTNIFTVDNFCSQNDCSIKRKLPMFGLKKCRKKKQKNQNFHMTNIRRSSRCGALTPNIKEDRRKWNQHNTEKEMKDTKYAREHGQKNVCK